MPPLAKLLVRALSGSALLSSALSAQIVFNNSSRLDAFTSRSTGQGVMASITVSSTQTLNQIGAYLDPSVSGNLKWAVFDMSTGTRLFTTDAVSFLDIGAAFYRSPVFTPVTLTVGTVYGIGAVADVAALWGFNSASSGNPYTQAGFTASDDQNGNLTNFTSPTLDGTGSAMIIVQLGVAPSTVPEPGTWALLVTGLAGVARVARTRRRGRSLT